MLSERICILSVLLLMLSALSVVLPLSGSTGNIHVNSKTAPSPPTTITFGENVSLYFGDVTWSGALVDLYLSLDGYASMTIPGDVRYGPTFDVTDIVDTSPPWHQFSDDGSRYTVGNYWINGTIPATLAIPQGSYYVKAFDGAPAAVAVTDRSIDVSILIEASFSDTPITLDGFVSGLDWVGFKATYFPSADGQGINGFYIKYDASSSKLFASLYVWSDNTPSDLDFAFLYFDMDHDGGEMIDTDDYLFVITRGGWAEDYGLNEATGMWDMNLNYTAKWDGYYVSVGNTWGVMWVIPMTIQDNQRLGIAIRQVDGPSMSTSDYPSTVVLGTPNTWAEVAFSKFDSSITVSASPTSITYGEKIELSAMIDPTTSRGTVTIEYSKDGGVWTEVASGTASDGEYSCTWTPTAAGSYAIRALWTGDIICRACTSTSKPATVEKASSSISTSLNIQTTTYGENVTVIGSITPALSAGLITAEFSSDKVEWTQIDSGAPSEGSCFLAWTPPNAGTFYIRTSWIGTENYLGSTSLDKTLTVNRAPTSLQISVSPEAAQIDPLTHGGADLEVSGSIDPVLEGIDVTITYTRPDGTTTTATTTTTSAGDFTDTVSPNQAGTWRISASWEGNTNYLASSSSPATVSIGENWLPYIAVIAIIAIVVVAAVALKMRQR